MNKKVSIIMGIYNCEETIGESIISLLDQTYNNWELIMCDDGSTDSTFSIASAYRDKYPDKIILIRNIENKGLNITLNKCLELATGEYIARMDGDDISLPTRLEEEVEILNRNKDIDIVSCPMIYFDSQGDWGQGTSIERPKKEDFIKGTPFCHAPCMVRREAFEKVGGYSVGKRLLRVEDYHLWTKMYAKGLRGYNLQKPLYKMRDDRAAYKRRKYKYRVNEAYVRAYAIRNLGLPIYSWIFVLRPLVIGILPKGIYNYLHKKVRR